MKHPDLIHFTSNRTGGVSPEPFDSLNLSFRVGDQSENVIENRQRLAQQAHIEIENLVTSQLAHSQTVAVVSTADRGKGSLDWESGIPTTDGLITSVPELPLMVIVADCAVVSFFDPQQQVIGLAHVGWKGALNGILENMVNVFTTQFGSQPQDLQIEISPCLGPECFEIGEDVYQLFKEKFGNKTENFMTPLRLGKYAFNLAACITHQLAEMGVDRSKIESTDICTKCHQDEYFSYRGAQGVTGRFGVVMMLQKTKPIT